MTFSPRSLEEIARDVAGELKAAHVQVSEIDVADVIRGMRKLFPLPPFIGYRRDNVQFAKKWIKWIESGQSLLADGEDGNSEFILAPVTQKRDGSSTKAFEELLLDMKNRASRIIEEKPGVHGLAGYQQERAATVARGFMDAHGLPLAYSSPTSTYRAVARLLLEGMMEQGSDGGEDIERACEVVAKRPAPVPMWELLCQL